VRAVTLERNRKTNAIEDRMQTNAEKKAANVAYLLKETRALFVTRADRGIRSLSSARCCI